MFVAVVCSTTVPSDSRCARLDFAVGLYEPRCPDPGGADGRLVFRSAPCPRAAPHTRRAPARVHLRTGAHGTSSSPRHDRLDARVVNLTRLQASLHVAARGLAPSEEALDTPLGPRDSRHASGVCYSALRRLPRRDLHPLEKNSVKRASVCLLRHDAPWSDSTPAKFRKRANAPNEPRATSDMIARLVRASAPFGCYAAGQ